MAEATLPALPARIDLQAWQQAEHDSSVLIVSGTKIQLQLRAGQLYIIDGPPGQPRTRRIAKQPRTVSRVLILGGHGYISAEAIRFMAWADISWSMLDLDNGDIIATSGPKREDARLLRSQCLAQDSGAALQITRNLLTVKLAGQAKTLREVFNAHSVARMVDEYGAELKHAETLDQCRTWEGQASVIYWQVFAERVAMPWSPKDMTKVPAHWLSFASRSSLAHTYQSNRGATDPVNAAINYLTRIAETEATHLCHAYGLSPQLGFLHSDKASRDSLSLDLLEPARPYLERIILTMLDTGLGVPYRDGKPAYLDRHWFTETHDGTVRLVAPLTHQLASHAAELGSVLRPHAEAATRTLGLAAKGELDIPRSRKARPIQAPATSSRPTRLRADSSAVDLVPDHVWQTICELLPPPPVTPTGRTGRPVDTSQDRACVAGLAANKLLGIPWTAVPVDVSSQLCNARHKAWQWAKTSSGIPIWDAIADVLTSSGHLRGLVAS